MLTGLPKTVESTDWSQAMTLHNHKVITLELMILSYLRMHVIKLMLSSFAYQEQLLSFLNIENLNWHHGFQETVKDNLEFCIYK